MRDRRLCRWYVAMCAGSTFAILDGCPLPDRYFENTTRLVTVVIADQILSNVLSELLGIDLNGTDGTGDPATGDGG